MPYDLIMESVNPSLSHTIKDFNKIPVTIGLILLNCIIYILYMTKVFKRVPCGDSLLDNVAQTFIHANLEHLIFNMFGILLASRIEVEMGSCRYLGLFLIIVGLDIVGESVIKNLVKMPCSVGISGVIFGLFAYEFVKLKTFNYVDLIGLIAMAIYPTIVNPKASLFSHVLGIIIGIVVGFFY